MASDSVRTARTDVLIAGGGMVGAALALALDHYSAGALRVTVVENHPLPQNAQANGYRPSFDARSSALTYGSRCIFDAWGLWSVLAERAVPIEHIHVGQRGSLGSVELRAADWQWPALGYVVENAWLGQVLFNELRRRPAVTWLSPATVQGAFLDADGAGVRVSMDGAERVLRTSLLAIADGADSVLRRQLGILARERDYRQQALIANVSVDQPHHHAAYERFTDWGPMALLPLASQSGASHRAALVWTLPDTRAEAVAALDNAALLALLQQRFGFRQGRFLQIGERYMYPLKLIESQEQIRHNLVVLGNAAHALHPVVGQGFNLALRDVTCLAQLLAAAHARGEDPGALAPLLEYVGRQQFDQARTIGFSDRVTALFGERNGILALLRGAGLTALDLSPSAKRVFIDHLAGTHPGAALG